MREHALVLAPPLARRLHAAAAPASLILRTAVIQTPLPTLPDSLVDVQLPSAWERWRDLYLHDVFAKVLFFVVLAVGLWALVRVVERHVFADVEDVNRRHRLRKWLRYVAFALVVLTGVALFADALAGLGTVLAVLAAGLAVALQDVLKSVVGWLYLSGRSGVHVGSRIEVQGVVGDVIDVGVLKTTMLEVGNLVYGSQTSGRIVTIPNHRMLTENVYLSNPGDDAFVWQEIRIVVTFESDWQRAEEILREVAAEHHNAIEGEMERSFRSLQRRYAYRPGTTTPIVYVSIADHGVDLTMRFLTHPRRRRGSVDTVARRVLVAFEAEPRVELAYPTYRIYRAGEGEGRET